MWKHNKVDADKETGIVQNVINAIKALTAQPEDAEALIFFEESNPALIDSFYAGLDLICTGAAERKFCWHDCATGSIYNS